MVILELVPMAPKKSGTFSGTIFGDHRLGSFSGTIFWDYFLRPFSGTIFWDHLQVPFKVVEAEVVILELIPKKSGTFSYAVMPLAGE